MTSAAGPVDEGPGWVVDLGGLARARWFRAAVLTVVIVVLELLVFWPYFSGADIPPWDFLSGYNTDAYLWWTQGGFFTPPEWISASWGGHPSALMLQDSAWYLPVGIASLFGPFTLHVSAIVSALHVGLGVVGTYLLVRSLRSSFAVSIVAATAGFFAVGYFSNAQHMDIARGYALIPFILLVLSPRWPWRAFWAVPVAALILWQSFTGIYPGMLVALVYVGVVWVVVNLLLARPRWVEYLVPLAVAGLTAVLLSAPRILPYLLLTSDRGSAAAYPETSAFAPSMIGTLLFGYGSVALGGEPALPNDVSMRSFFIPATILVLALFARRRDPATKLGIAIGAPALLLGVPVWPWFGAVQELPGLDLSRFTMSDFKPFIILGAVLVASSGLTALLELAGAHRVPRRTWVSFGLAALLFAGLAFIGVNGPFDRNDWFPPLVVLVLALCAVAGFVRWRGLAGTRVLGAAALVIITIVSGLVWTSGTRYPWATDRVQAETAVYGSTVDDLLAQPRPVGNGAQRAARMPLGEDRSSGALHSAYWNRVSYLGQDAVAGYVNLKGSLTITSLEDALTDQRGGAAFAAFLAAPGTILTVPQGEPTAVQLAACGVDGECGDAVVTPVSYSPSGHFAYDVELARPMIGYANEAYFEGWHAQACSEGGSCAAVEAGRSDDGVIRLDLPKGSYRLVLDYGAPGAGPSWIAFWLGVLIAAGSALVTLRRQRRPTR